MSMCRFYSLLYNGEAVDAENYVRNDESTVFERPSLFLQPVVFDAEVSFVTNPLAPLTIDQHCHLSGNWHDRRLFWHSGACQSSAGVP